MAVTLYINFNLIGQTRTAYFDGSQYSDYSSTAPTGLSTIIIPSTIELARADSGATFGVMMHEFRVWATERTRYDLFNYRKTDLTKYRPVALVAYWQFQKDIYNLGTIYERSPNGFGKSAKILNSAPQWISTGITLCAHLNYFDGSNCVSECKTYRNNLFHYS